MQKEQEHTELSQCNRTDSIIADSSEVKIRSNGAREKACSGLERPANDFLNERFSPIPSSIEIETDAEIDKEVSIRNVFSSIRQYLKLLGREMQTTATGKFSYDINNALIELDANLTEWGLYSNLELSGKVLHVNLVRRYPVFDMSFTFLPISSVGKMPELLADVFLDFVGFYARTQGVCLPLEHEDFSYYIDEDFLEEYDEGLCEEKRAEELENYRPSGMYDKYFSRISKSKNTDTEILNKLQMLKQLEKGENLALISCMEEGIPILASDTITSYDYNPDENDCEALDGCYNYEPFNVNRNYAICWDFSDYVVECVQESINCMLREVYCYGAMDSIRLSATTDSLFKKRTFPEKFEKWFIKFVNLLENYGTNK